MNSPVPTLLEITEPLFQYICRLNRIGRQGGNVDFISLREEIRAHFATMKAKAGSEFRLSKQYELIEQPLVFFTDSMIAESKLPCAKEWRKNFLAKDHTELAGDEKFFDLLEETMKDPGEEATERLAVFYTCIGLGFQGVHCLQPELLRKQMLDLSTRIRQRFLDADTTERLCPETYQNVDEGNLFVRPGGRLWLMVAMFAVCALTALVCNIYLFLKAYGTLNASLAEILKQGANLGH